MKKIFQVILTFLLILLLGFLCPGYSQTVPLSFTQLTSDLNRPGAGANEWSYDQNVVNIPDPNVSTQRLDRYWRFTWLDFQPAGGSAGVYDFKVFDSKIQQSITKGQSFSFGVMQQCGGCDANLQTNISGAKMLYPTWLHTLMQSETTKDFISGGEWFPNYNSPNYLTAWKNLNVAINSHIMTGSFNGVRYQDVIGQIDIRGYGDYGEWTNNVFTAGNITVATGDSIISYVVHAFDKFQCVYMMATVDGGQLSNTNVPPGVGYYALMASNSVGKLGWRRDSWGQTDNYLSQWTDANNTSFGGITFKDSIMKRFWYAPIVGEPQDGGSAGNFAALPGQMGTYGVTSFGNGNFNNSINTTIQNNFRAASKAAGYALTISSGTMTANLVAGGAYNISLNWKNLNGIPAYYNWRTVIEWRNSSNAVLQRDTTSFRPRFFRSTTDVLISDNLTLRTVPAGSGYTCYLRVVDPTDFRDPMPLFISGQQADGSYPIRSNVTVTGSGAVANAGPNQNITITSTTLDGSASLGATSYSWTRLSGPNSPSITTPATVSTTVTGLITGTYVFQLAINGGSSGPLISPVSVIVNTPVVSANPGNNQTITLPTNTVTLSGAASTGATSYLWTNVSGPTTPVIVSPSAFSTQIGGLVQGTYVFNLSINSGASNRNVTVVVLPAPLPVANAGPDQTITLPVSSITLDGTASTGSISSYAWSKISGPAASIATPATASTIVSGLTAGKYLFQLAVNGGSTDTCQITVNPAIPPATTIFGNQGTNNRTRNDGPQSGITGIELGMKFRTTIAGYITGIRFYKTRGNNGTHIGQLYTSSGSLLASATFKNETRTGWQTVQLTTPIPITVNTTYVAAYFSSLGNYVSTNNYFGKAVVNTQLSALANGTDGVNGLFKYTATAAFPNASFNKANYWVDVVFSITNPGTVPAFTYKNIYVVDTNP